METFKYTPAPGASFDCKPNVKVAKYGDGYEQRVGMALNSKARKWSVKFASPFSAALAFIEARSGVESFMWTDPLGVSGMYVCREWKVAHVGADRYELTCDFEQVFE